MKDPPILYQHKEFPLLSKEEEIRLAKIIAGDNKIRKRDAIDKLVNSNVRLVSKLLKKYSHLDLDLDDLFAEGLFGLCIAAEKFDYSKGNRFSTFSYYWIRHKMHRFVESNLNIIKIPVHVQDTLKIYFNCYEELLNKNNNEPTFEMLVSYSGLNANKLKNALRYGIVSINSLFGSVDGNEIEYEDPRMQNLLDDKLMEVALENLKKDLNEEQCYVLDCLVMNLPENEIEMQRDDFLRIKAEIEHLVIDLLWGE